MASNTTKVNGISKVVLDSGAFTQQKWTESGVASANTFIIEPVTSLTSLSLTGTTGDTVVIKGYSGDYSAKLSGKVLTLQSDTQTVNITLASSSTVILTFLDGNKKVDANAKTVDAQVLTKIATHLDGPTAHEIKSLATAAANATTHENSALATAAANAITHENAALANAQATITSDTTNTITTLLSNSTKTITSALDAVLPGYSYQNDLTGSSLNLSVNNTDGTRSDVSSSNDNNGHQITAISVYDSTGKLISTNNSDGLSWQEDSGTSHTKSTTHSFVNHSDGSQTETFSINDDSQINTLTTEYDSSGAVLSVIEGRPDNTRTEAYSNDDGNGHLTSNVYDYDSKGNLINSIESDTLNWQDSSNITYTKENTHTLIVHSDGTQTETYKTNRDGQISSSTTELDAVGSIISIVDLHADNSQTETYITDDNNGHQITTVYEYDPTGKRTSICESDSLVWLEDTGISHRQENTHTVTTNTDGTQSETFSTNNDGVITSTTLEEVNSSKTNTIPPYDAGSTNFAFVIASGNYTFNIANFGVGDSLIFPTNDTPKITNASNSDGTLDVVYTNNNATTIIHLTGISALQDASIGTSYDNFLTAFATSN